MLEVVVKKPREDWLGVLTVCGGALGLMVVVIGKCSGKNAVLV